MNAPTESVAARPIEDTTINAEDKEAPESDQESRLEMAETRNILYIFYDDFPAMRETKTDHL